LQELLTNKRAIFPRFYFLSDDEVLEVISSGENETIQGMLNKIFDGITRLKVADSGYDTMISKEKEEIKFTKVCKNTGAIE
jgi:dynein heavy chain, axonemal